MKKEIGGVTKVPREYVFHGTNQRTNEGSRDEREFRKKWQALYDEAVRQEKRAQEIEADYAAALANERFEREQKRAMSASNSSSDQSIDAALAKCKLYVAIRKSQKGKKKTMKCWCSQILC